MSAFAETVDMFLSRLRSVASDWLWSVAYCLMAALAMGYAWGYRGTVGHEYGAMVPGAILGLMLCLGSGRLDWHRRSAVVGLFAAVGWSWGGSLSYMEQTFYALSDSAPDVVYAFAVIFLLGALWAGCGGALLGLGLTERRSELESLTRAFIAVCTAYLAAFIYLSVFPEHRQSYLTFTVKHLHNGDWLAATLTLVASSLYWIASPRDRKATALFVWGAVAWWLGYGLMTFVGGLRLAPLHRSESWGGVLGVLVALIIYLVRRKNRAALMLCFCGCLGGGFAFVLAVFLHNALWLRWGVFADIEPAIPYWVCAEVTFGFLMGLFMAMATLRLLRGGIAPAVDDGDRAPLDAFSVFAVTIALFWINSRRHLDRILKLAPGQPDYPFLGIPTGGWYVLLGILLSLSAMFLLWRYRRGDRGWAPQSAFGKGAAIVMLLLWGTIAAQLLEGPPTRREFLHHLVRWLPATLATCLLVSFTPRAERTAALLQSWTPSTDPRWRVGVPFVVGCVLMLAVVPGIGMLNVQLQQGPAEGRSRLRFGPQAYWRQADKLQGTWNVIGLARSPDSSELSTEDLPIQSIEFDANRNATALLANGDTETSHRWFLHNQYIWLHWFAKFSGHPNQQQVPLDFVDNRIYVALPSGSEQQGDLVLERVDD